MCAHPAKAALNQAEREGLVVINAARLVEMEPGRRPTVQPLEPAELGRLLDYMASDELGPLFETIASTGLRRGEALALRWSDVDLDVGVMVSTPKMSSGVRTIELDAHNARDTARPAIEGGRRPGTFGHRLHRP
jgi:integrase